MFCMDFVRGAGPCLASGRSTTLEKQSCLFGGCTNEQIAPDLLHQELHRGSVACEGSCSHQQAPVLPLTTCEQTQRHFKQNTNEHHLPRGPSTSDNSWNSVVEVLDLNAAGLIYTRGIWTEVTHGKQSYEERGRFYTTSSSQEATEPPLPSLAKLKKRKEGRMNGETAKGSAPNIYAWAGHEQQLLCTSGHKTLPHQYLGKPQAPARAVGSDR